MEEYHRVVARLDRREGLQEQLAASVEASHHAMAGHYGELASSLPEAFVATDMSPLAPTRCSGAAARGSPRDAQARGVR